jgi:glycosyltransferase involved in cell wall biosynthesis
MQMSSLSKYKLSIIVPAYNVNEYIKACLDSLVAEGLDAEIIVVNDGSTDSTPDVIEKWRQKNHDIVVLNKVNGGLSSARNEGIKIAQGEYLMFIDGDDWVDNAHLLKMKSYLDSNNPDIVIMDFIKYWSEEEKEVISGGLREYEEIKGDVAFREYLKGNVVITACNKVIRKSLIIETKFEFPIGKLYEDVPVGILLYKSSTVVHLPYPFYFYRQRSGSITKTFSQRIYEKHDVLLIIKEFLLKEQIYSKYEMEYNAFYIKVCLIQMILFVLKSQSSFMDKKECLRKFFEYKEAKAAWNTISSNPYINKREVVFLYMAKYAPGIASKLINSKKNNI